MFKNNHHTAEYNQIIEHAKLRGDQYRSRYLAKKHLGYVETHHVIPSSIGGADTRKNTVWLTAYEHLKCHMLLTEMCENEGHRQKMLLAVTRMMNKQDIRREREKLLPLQVSEEDLRWLAQIRQDCAEAHSKYMSERVRGEQNPFYGKKHSPEQIEAYRQGWTGDNNCMRRPEVAAKLSGDNHYSKKEEHKGKHAGQNNGRYNSTQHYWENIYTGETKIATRLEMITCDRTLKSGISSVITGKSKAVKGWRIVTQE